jgi:hypothetical protein
MARPRADRPGPGSLQGRSRRAACPYPDRAAAITSCPVAGRLRPARADAPVRARDEDGHRRLPELRRDRARPSRRRLQAGAARVGWTRMRQRHEGGRHAVHPQRSRGRASAGHRSYMPPTPQHAWPLLAERVGAQVWVKHENHTPTGSFKVRGALTFIDWLKHTTPTRAASARRRAAITGRGRPGRRRRRG